MHCTQCGQQVPAGQKFCGNCGAPVESGTPAAVVPAPLPARPRRRFKWWHWLIVGWGVLAVLTCVIVYAVTVNSPEYRAERTATAAAQLTKEAGPTDTPKPTNTARPTNTPRPSSTPRLTATPAPPTTTPAPEEAYRALAQEVLGSNLLTVTLDTAATIEYDLGTQWDENSAVRTAIRHWVSLTPRIFAIVDVEQFVLNAHTEFTDVYGNTARKRAFSFVVTRSAAAKINWSEFNTHNTNYILLSEEDCDLYVHPALRQAWNQYANE